MEQNIVTRHAYDLELKSFLINYSKQIVKSDLKYPDKDAEYFYDLIKFCVDEYCKSKGIDFDSELQIIIQPSAMGPYEAFLAYSLIFYDLEKIRLYLNYQEEQYNKSHNTNDFVGRIEFRVSEILKYSSPFDNTHRLNAVMRWVEDKRNHTQNGNFDIANYQEDEKINQVELGEKPIIRSDEIEKGTSSESILEWDKLAVKKLFRLSGDLFKEGYTKELLDFRDAILSGKVIAWQKNIESWVYLMYCLACSPYNYLSSAKGKAPYFSFASRYFKFDSSYTKGSKNIAFSVMLTRIRNEKIKKHVKTKSAIDILLYQIFRPPEK